MSTENNSDQIFKNSLKILNLWSFFLEGISMKKSSRVRLGTSRPLLSVTVTYKSTSSVPLLNNGCCWARPIVVMPARIKNPAMISGLKVISRLSLAFQWLQWQQEVFLWAREPRSDGGRPMHSHAKTLRRTRVS